MTTGAHRAAVRFRQRLDEETARCGPVIHTEPRNAQRRAARKADKANRKRWADEEAATELAAVRKAYARLA